MENTKRYRDDRRQPFCLCLYWSTVNKVIRMNSGLHHQSIQVSGVSRGRVVRRASAYPPADLSAAVVGWVHTYSTVGTYDQDRIIFKTYTDE